MEASMPMSLHQVANSEHVPAHFLAIPSMRGAAVETLHGVIDHHPPKRIEFFYPAGFQVEQEFRLIRKGQVDEIPAGSLATGGG
jgi:hypothetical protein